MRLRSINTQINSAQIKSENGVLTYLFLEYRAKSPSAPSKSLPKPRSRTVPFLNGSVLGLVTPSDTTPREGTGARPVWVSKFVNFPAVSSEPFLSRLVIDSICSLFPRQFDCL
ncbi:hypothetical protein BGW36DRAFT_373155 [Talaromyces proteolyticus]|uniref:Uncharacterized protein n=1 Tax=Talaromyces proteolyticus TaxID=1131652 RepID=A0AAD4KYG1_9EURO|nr:uncharacterized protein BGW36DRAFT_373155 [Talaromyces proteolyticus]KAH8702586.1 hypothetical protein BGW36DRAFT_373155 [Talaromyces proteolyticus]